MPLLTSGHFGFGSHLMTLALLEGLHLCRTFMNYVCRTVTAEQWKGLYIGRNYSILEGDAYSD